MGIALHRHALEIKDIALLTMNAALAGAGTKNFWPAFDVAFGTSSVPHKQCQLPTMDADDDEYMFEMVTSDQDNASTVLAPAPHTSTKHPALSTKSAPETKQSRTHPATDAANKIQPNQEAASAGIEGPEGFLTQHTYSKDKSVKGLQSTCVKHAETISNRELPP